jgi:methionyl aminopeptidase
MISVKTDQEIAVIGQAAHLLAGIMFKLKKAVRPGIASNDLNDLAENLILSAGAKPAFKGYQGFPASLCLSFNEQIVHGLPFNRTIKDGDLVSFDLGLAYNGFYADMAETVIVGKPSKEKKEILAVCHKALEIAVSQARPGNRLGDLGFKVQEYVKSRGFNVIRDLCGHGIGRELHEEPQVLNYGRPKTGEKIVKGMVLCLEPMVSSGDWRIKKAKDGFSYQTKDGSLSCHFERMVLVTENGAKILTNI